MKPERIKRNNVKAYLREKYLKNLEIKSQEEQVLFFCKQILNNYKPEEVLLNIVREDDTTNF